MMVNVKLCDFLMVIWRFTSLSALYKSYRDDGIVKMQSSVLYSHQLAKLRLQRYSNPEARDPKSGVPTSRVRGCNQKVCFLTLGRKAHNVKMTSNQRRCDVITSHRRLYDVILMLCAYWVLICLEIVIMYTFIRYVYVSIVQKRDGGWGERQIVGSGWVGLTAKSTILRSCRAVRQGSNPRPPDHQLDAHPTEPKPTARDAWMLFNIRFQTDKQRDRHLMLLFEHP